MCKWSNDWGIIIDVNWGQLWIISLLIRQWERSIDWRCLLVIFNSDRSEFSGNWQCTCFNNNAIWCFVNCFFPVLYNVIDDLFVDIDWIELFRYNTFVFALEERINWSIWSWERFTVSSFDLIFILIHSTFELIYPLWYDIEYNELIFHWCTVPLKFNELILLPSIVLIIALFWMINLSISEKWKEWIAELFILTVVIDWGRISVAMDDS